MFYAILATVDEGDEVIYPNPGFPIYESMINFVGGKPVPLRLREDREFRFDIEDLKALITPKTKMLIVNTPQNPTGGILTKEDIEAISKLAIEHNFIVFSDEIYSRVVYGDFQHFSFLQVPGMKERTIMLDGFSKTYAMTGWRLGYGVMPKDIAALVSKLQTNCASCTSSFTQMAGIEALEGPQESVNEMVAEFQRRRDAIVDGLNSIPGFRCLRPHGAFYVFPNIEGTGMKSQEIADSLLPAARHFAQLLGRQFVESADHIPTNAAGKVVFFTGDITEHEMREKVASSDGADLIILENLRFYKGEEDNGVLFSEQLASMADVYVNDAFAVCHRKAASVAGITKHLPSYGGLLLEESSLIILRLCSMYLGGKIITFCLRFLWFGHGESIAYFQDFYARKRVLSDRRYETF
jgi:histidinol-phosphate/aromatic aminotransferase/cobyric acid decarboxylase-like protein